jgi:serine phosphatase RsbU (regulator of sigma subunit)
VDSKGKIHLSGDLSHNGLYLNDFVPPDVVRQVLRDDDKAPRPKVIEYSGADGSTMDLAYQSTRSTSWKLALQVPRSESIAILGTIKLNTVIAGLISLLLMIFVFYFVSRRIADPLKRALLLTKEMENKVSERTRELAEKNRNIIDSINYAKRLQEAILPTADEMAAVFGDYFVLWKPRDIVGGDFYWVRRIDADRSLTAVIDCTGHGIPGAFMTMAVNSILNHIVDQNYNDPAAVLAELNRRLKATLHRKEGNEMADDGLDIGLCLFDRTQGVTFAGAKTSLFVKQGDKVEVIRGDAKSIGYRSSRADLEFTSHSRGIDAGVVFYMTTDGYLDQNGGDKDFPFGRERLVQALIKQGGRPVTEQREDLAKVLGEYMGNEPQRDDITMLGFKYF